MQKSQSFNTIKNNTSWLGQNVGKEYLLGIDAYKKQQALVKNTVKQNDQLTHLDKPMNIQPTEVDKDKFLNSPDKTKNERYEQWLKNVQSDLYINETVNIVEDIIGSGMSNTAKH